MYHHIKIPDVNANSVEISLDVLPVNFEEQMNYFYRKGFETITLDEVFTSYADDKFVITFDDGYKDVLTNALPILKNLKYTATVFLIVDNIGKDGYLTWGDIHLLEGEGWFFGSHTLSHANLTTASQTKAKEQITQSKAQLDRKLEKPVTFLSYPSGQFNQGVIEMVKEASYNGAVTTLEGRNNSLEDIYQLKRIRVSGTDSLSKFIEKLNGSSKTSTSTSEPKDE